MTFGERLVASRKAAGYSQKQLAELLSITPSRLNYWEKDKREPDVEMVRAIAQNLNVSADYLIDNPILRKNAQSVSDRAQQVAMKYDELDEHGKRMVDIVIDEETTRMNDEDQPDNVIPLKKIIPLFGDSFAAGPGEPDAGNLFVEYEVPSDSPAEFAIRIHGDSMEPYLPDGSIALGKKETPRDGDVAAILLDGAFLCKQVCEDIYGNLYMFSLNRERSDMDVTIWHDSDRYVKCFGTIIMKKRLPLPNG